MGADLPRSQALTLSMKPTAAGFIIRCRADLDGDGDFAKFQANQALDGVRTTDNAIE